MLAWNHPTCETPELECRKHKRRFPGAYVDKPCCRCLCILACISFVVIAAALATAIYFIVNGNSGIITGINSNPPPAREGITLTNSTISPIIITQLIPVTTTIPATSTRPTINSTATTPTTTTPTTTTPTTTTPTATTPTTTTPTTTTPTTTTPTTTTPTTTTPTTTTPTTTTPTTTTSTTTTPAPTTTTPTTTTTTTTIAPSTTSILIPVVNGQFLQYDGVRLPGGTSRRSGITLEECENICLNDPTCTGFDYNLAGNACFSFSILAHSCSDFRGDRYNTHMMKFRCSGSPFIFT